MNIPSITKKNGYVVRGEGMTYLSRNFHFIEQGAFDEHGGIVSEGMDHAWVHDLADLQVWSGWMHHARLVYPATYYAAGDITAIRGDPVGFVQFLGKKPEEEQVA